MAAFDPHIHTAIPPPSATCGTDQAASPDWRIFVPQSPNTNEQSHPEPDLSFAEQARTSLLQGIRQLSPALYYLPPLQARRRGLFGARAGCETRGFRTSLNGSQQGSVHPGPTAATFVPHSDARRGTEYKTEYNGWLRERVARPIDRAPPPEFLNLFHRIRLKWRVTPKEITS